MPGDIAHALGQLGDRRIWSVILLTAALTALALAGLVWVGATLLAWLLPDTLSLPFIGAVDLSGGWVAWLSGLPFLVLSAVLVAPVALAVMSLFLERIADAVEARHYPGLPPARGLPVAAALREAVRFLGLVVVVNLAALVVYVVSAVFAPLVFWAVNGFLLGREYYQLVAARRLGLAGADALRRRHRGEIWLTGALLAVPLTVPVLNLFVPVIGVAAFTHQFHRHRMRGAE
ncbi:hypothetical protein HMH01_14300 [Halovulum dunhuangense]|uniref:CysZ protein n=1 Tax=Halovulum dunhuangense TaxID=1505036 RepID=A0A849L582_9RHOB|nr:EI24 domain-containing protein [Halovulum dunhuangense]NNU81608.1 hypothetical protein [Halovulum dunhuangense]